MQAPVMRPWGEPRQQLDHAALLGLLDGSVPLVRIAGFASTDECRRACEAIRDPARARCAATTTRMDLIGANFSNHAGPRKSDYFDRVADSFAAQQAVFGASFDVMGRVLEVLRAAWPGDVDIAEEPGYGRYFAGGIKTRETASRLHFDYVPHFAPDHVIGQVVDQLSWNIYLEMPDGTGETTLYQAPVSREHRPRDTEDGYTALPRHHVDGVPHLTYRGEVGELVLFNTRYPHQIRIGTVPPGQSRIQVGSFIGRTADDRLVLWS